ncbi:MAG: adaptor protein MecA [Clostridia bacterium]|nr:adaptor protein MecA [Clostridia bacterium]
MDLIKISDSKLKIMLTCTDMSNYDLHNDRISFADAHVRRVLRRLLADAREQTGFDSDMTRLYVQMYPSADGGCELFISKLEEQSEGMEPDASHHLPVPSLPSPLIQGRALRKTERHGRDMCAYSFLRLNDLICVCKRLISVGFSGKSSLYVDKKHVYYLFLRDFSTPSLYSPDEYCFLAEYGVRENARMLQTYIGEYGQLICAENAAQTMSAL